MPVRPIAWERFDVAASYPHMAKHDVRIWERFLTRYAGYFDEVAYDVGLGGSQPTDPLADERERLMWQWNTSKRVDALARNRDELWLVEVRPHAGLAAVGAVLGYTYLAELDGFADRPLIMVIATDQTDADIRTVCKAFDVQLIELPEPDFGEPTPGGTP